MLVPGEPDAVIVAPTVDVERMVAPQTQGFGEGHLKYCGDFVLAGMIVQIGGDNTHHRRHLKTGDAVHWRQNADHLDGFRGDRDFFLGFAQGGGDKRRIGIIYRAAGKGDLTGVLAQQRRTLGQQQAGLRPAHDRHQHRRLPLIERMARRLGAQQLEAGQKIIQIEGVSAMV